MKTTSDKMCLVGIIFILVAIAISLFVKIAKIPVDGENVAWYIKIAPLLGFSGIGIGMAGIRIRPLERISKIQEQEEEKKWNSLDDFERSKKLEKGFRKSLGTSAAGVGSISLIVLIVVFLNIIFSFNINPHAFVLIYGGFIMFFISVPWIALRWNSTARTAKKYRVFKLDNICKLIDRCFIFTLISILLFSLNKIYSSRLLYLIVFIFGVNPVLKINSWVFLKKDKEV